MDFNTLLTVIDSCSNDNDKINIIKKFIPLSLTTQQIVTLLPKLYSDAYRDEMLKNVLLKISDVDQTTCKTIMDCFYAESYKFDVFKLFQEHVIKTTPTIDYIENTINSFYSESYKLNVLNYWYSKYIIPQQWIVTILKCFISDSYKLDIFKKLYDNLAVDINILLSYIDIFLNDNYKNYCLNIIHNISNQKITYDQLCELLNKFYSPTIRQNIIGQLIEKIQKETFDETKHINSIPIECAELLGIPKNKFTQNVLSNVPSNESSNFSNMTLINCVDQNGEPIGDVQIGDMIIAGSYEGDIKGTHVIIDEHKVKIGNLTIAGGIFHGNINGLDVNINRGGKFKREKKVQHNNLMDQINSIFNSLHPNINPNQNVSTSNVMSKISIG